MRIPGKTVLITGAASGLGAATARALAAAQAHVAVLDRNESAARALAAEIGAMPLTADVTSASEMEAAIALLGRIHILVNCAGVGDPMRVLNREGQPASLEAFARVIQINLIGTFNSIRLAAARMNANKPDEEGERGVIINTASIAAFDGQIGQA